ncbi:MAG: MBL fold metallo-hydrolase [Prevotella sp.]|nr:MBL fold metallo-hydrolase [Prevotella sp.]MDD7045840.1 MBL fold metallo-hydrolase [Prevotella sp.]MDY5546597.1 MBL fold metallo-hydrolase [Prevotella sp.]
MLNIQKFVCNMIQENCYVVSDETKECIIVDCGAYYEEERRAIVDYIRHNQLTPKHLVATHGHIDHNFGNNTIYEAFGLKPEVEADDEQLINMLPQQAQAIAGVELDYKMPPVGKYLRETDTISFGSHTFTLLHTPGHTPGGVFYYCKEEKVAFSGDTLFRGSIGRTDLPGGNSFLIIQSLRMIAQLPDDTTILPGHGQQTTIGYELRSNPYMDR